MISSWRRKARRLGELDGPSRRLVLGSALMLPLFWARVKLIGRCELGPADPAGQHTAESLGQASIADLKHVGQIVNRVAHHVLPPDNCLTRAVYLQWLLRRRGVQADLRLGVQLVHGQLRAHAWVEAAGHPLNDSDDVAERYLPFDQPLAPEPWPAA
ncbi:MAG: lasso peptide biosynthesis B2 protein [Prochlorococcaceae cyanobacterium]